jgi:hypothetical protein
VPVGVHELVPSLGDLSVRQVQDALADPVRRRHRDLDLGHHAEHADGDLAGVEQLRRRLRHLDHLAGARDDAGPAQGRGERAEANARAVRAGADRATDLLGVDVALVREREARLPQRLAERPDAGAGERRRTTTLGVGAEHAGEIRELQHNAIGEADRREGVTGGGDAHVPARRDGVADRGDDLALVAGTQHGHGVAGLVAHPVRPGRSAHDACLARPPGCRA